MLQSHVYGVMQFVAVCGVLCDAVCCRLSYGVMQCVAVYHVYITLFTRVDLHMAFSYSFSRAGAYSTRVEEDDALDKE